MDNAADVEQVKEKGQRQKSNREHELDDVFFILGTKEGRRFFWRYLERCGIFRLSMTGNNTTFFNEGERSIGLCLLADLNETCPEAYVVMQKEAAEARIKQKVIRENKTKKEEAKDG